MAAGKKVTRLQLSVCKWNIVLRSKGNKKQLITCFYCENAGHISRNCKIQPSYEGKGQTTTQGVVSIKGLRDGYNLFVWMGHLSHVNNVKRISNIEWHGGVSRLNIKIRLLKGISFATGKQIDIKEIGVGSEPVKISIHRIDSKSKWISETVEVI